MDLVSISTMLAEQVQALQFSAPVSHVYNPLVYAAASHAKYLQRYGTGKKRTILLGMNPGPFGMAQTGIPFGDVAFVRDWLGICEVVQSPQNQHPKRPILGFSCTRAEVSGTRLWGWAKARFSTPDHFFKDFFVVNYCPLVFMEPSGANRTPDKLPRAEQQPLFNACDHALRAIISHLRPKLVVGIGAFAEARAEAALQGCGVAVGGILHPSPANPQANRGWPQIAESQLRLLGVELPRTGADLG